MAEHEKSWVFNGNITYPYSWATGKAIGAFLTALRDDKKILGAKCTRCNKVFVPPQEFCPLCFEAIEGFVTLGDEGVIETYTVVHKAFPWRPVEPPYVLASIKLSGADTNLVHLVKTAQPDAVRTGQKVRAVWKDERLGSLMDIEGFAPVGK